jgi:phage baseplate assembly protein V
MLKFGVVTQTDPATCRVRVRYKDNEGIESYWLAVAQRKTLQDHDYHMPDVGEHVACLIDAHNEEGVVLGAIYSAADATPVQNQDKRHLAFKDGATFEYDRSKHKLTAKLPEGTAEITVDKKLVLKLPDGQARITIQKEGYVEIQGATVIVLHDAADIDCRTVLRLRGKERIEM